MIPKGSQAIGHLATRIAMDLVPKAADAYAGADLNFIIMLLMMVGQDYDRAADVLVREHEMMTGLLISARPHFPALTAVINAALTYPLASLRIPDLNARADVMVKALIAVHAAVEDAVTIGDEWARPINREIWKFLDGYAARRAYDIPF
jgi:hypothetical protein